MPLMPPFHDTRIWYHALIAENCLHVDRFAVLLTASLSFNITLLQFGKRFFKARISSKQYKFLCEIFRLFLGSKKSKKYACDLLQKEKEAFKIHEVFLILSRGKLRSHL